MVSELEPAGYEDIRQFVDPTRSDPANWDYLALFDSDDNEVLRVQISNDSRTSWEHSSGDQTLVVEGTFSGSDSDLSQGITITAAGLFNQSGTGNGDPRTKDTMTGVAIDSDSAAIDLIHEVELPQV